MKHLRNISWLISASILSGCSWFYSEEGLIRDTENDYLQAKQTADLKIPSGLQQKNKVDNTPIPAIGEKAKRVPINQALKIKSPIQVLAVLENVREDKNAANPAVFIADDTDFIWEAIVSLFDSNQVTLAVNDKTTQTIQTGWIAEDEKGVWLGIASAEDIDEFKSQYLIQLAPGQLKDEKQIQVSRIAAEKINDDTGEWESLPNYWDDAAPMLNRIISSYNNAIIQRDLAQKAKVIAGFKVKLTEDKSGAAALITDAPMEQVWEKLPKVLRSMTFEISDRDRRLMTYFTRFEALEEGFFASLFDNEIDTLPLETGDYQVILRELGEQTVIMFQDGQGAALDAVTMTKLYPTLSKLFGSNR